MAEGDGTASLIEFLVWDAELFNAVSGLTGEGLVYFEAIDVFDVETHCLRAAGMATAGPIPM